MAVIREQDLGKGRDAWLAWRQSAFGTVGNVLSEPDPLDETHAQAAGELGETGSDGTDSTATGTPLSLPRAQRLSIAPTLPRPIMAMAVRYTLHLLECKAPGPGVEVRVAPWGAIKILDGPASDPHNLTPPDVIELDPPVWLRLAAGITTWAEEKEAGRISAVGERDDLSDLLPL